MPNIDLGWGEGQNDLEKYKRWKRDPSCINNPHEDGCQTLDLYNENSFMDIYLSKQLESYENGMCAVNDLQITDLQKWTNHQLYCNSGKYECFESTKMHVGLPYFFEKTEANKPEGWILPTKESCQDSVSTIFGDSPDE